MCWISSLTVGSGSDNASWVAKPPSKPRKRHGKNLNKWSCGMDASETEAQQRCVAMPSYSPGIACGQTKYGFRTGLTCLVLPKRPPVANQRVGGYCTIRIRLSSMSLVPRMSMHLILTFLSFPRFPSCPAKEKRHRQEQLNSCAVYFKW